jgi:8-oxo-dGTP pyrophosphatase MutT (NUDIX family)
MIECITHYGQKKLLAEDKLTFRPSVYAIIVDKGKVLLLNTRHTGTYSLPGGGIDIGEPIEVALKREVREETGLEIEVVRFHRFKEQFFYYDPTDEAFHSFLFFYVCRPKTFEICADSQIDDESVEKPRWVEVEGLQEEEFHNHGQLILEVLHSE